MLAPSAPDTFKGEDMTEGIGTDYDDYFRRAYDAIFPNRDKRPKRKGVKRMEQPDTQDAPETGGDEEQGTADVPPRTDDQEQGGGEEQDQASQE